MKPSSLLSLCSRWIAVSTLWAVAAAAHNDLVLKSTPTLSFETTALVRLLEECNYNRAGVKIRDYAEIIPDYMTELDGQRLFFLASDPEHFAQTFPPRTLYTDIASLGKIDAAFSIFDLYQTRVEERVSWILNELKKEVDLTTHDTFVIDRAKAPWPADRAEGDALWGKRLKFEIIQEMLNQKSAEDAKQSVRKRYERMLKNLEEIESSDVVEMFLSTIARMYDPHSTYFSADTFEDFSIQLRLQLVGIGAVLAIEDDCCVVKEIITGGPADLSKQLHPNDKIISVSQGEAEPLELMGLKLRKIVERIRGEKGSQLKLVIQPADATDPSARREIVLTRDVVNLNSARARAAIFDVPDAAWKLAPIGVITLPGFYGFDPAEGGEKSSAAKDVAELLHQLQQTGIRGLVLDLRQNGGGLVSEAIDVAGLFIKQGPILQVKNYYGEVKVDSDENPAVEYTGPLAVLVSKFSASASEIVAGALQNYGRAIVVGDSSTHGKGSVQVPMELRNLNTGANRDEKMGAVKITIQKFYLPNGQSTQLKGVIPDIVLPSIDDYLPIGETTLPHALVWDEIPSTKFDGKPLDARVVTPLRLASAARQAKLEEFTYLNKTIAWFKTKQEQKSVSLNFEERQHVKEADKQFRKAMDREKTCLEKTSFAYREFRLGALKTAVPPPEPAKKTDSDSAPDEDDEIPLPDNGEQFAKMDIHLRETLRILSDALEMGRKRERWASDHAPLTAAKGT